MNLQEELKLAKERVAELEELAKDEKGFPQDGDNYWYINPLGIVLRDEWLGFVSERYMIEIGNVFKTEQDAHFAVEKLKVDTELRKLSDSWDLEITQYTFSFDWECGELKIEYPDYNEYPNSYYFYSADDLQQAIETVGRGRIKKYIFGVEEQ